MGYSNTFHVSQFIYLDWFNCYSSEYVSTFDEQSASLIRLNNGTTLYLREINKFLAMVCILREFNVSRRGTIDYNFLCFHEAIHKIFAVRLSKKYASLNNHIYDADDDDDEDDVQNNNNNRNNNSQSDEADEGDDEDGDSQSCDIRPGSQLEKYLLYMRSGARTEDWFSVLG